MSQPTDATLLKRACRVAAHEICHVFGLRHCSKWRCLMNGSNSIVESDSRPVLLCPDCLEKLEWRLGFDRKKRYSGLRAFYSARPEFADEARKCGILGR